MSLPAKPKTILIATIGGGIHICLRRFKTVNGGKDNPDQFLVQMYESGRWRVRSQHKTLGAGIIAYDELCAKFERIWGPREKPEFTSKWNNLYVEEPDHGYVAFSCDLPALPERQAA